MPETVEQFKDRFAKLRVMRERTGAPLSACDEALKACGGDIDLAVEHRAVWLKRATDGDPWHRCRDDCPPWPFRWVQSARRPDHLCSTHCRRHPDPRMNGDVVVRAQVLANPQVIAGALSICDWDPERAAQFLREAARG